MAISKEKELEKIITKIANFFDAKAELIKEKDGFLVNISSENSGLLIGHFGETLEMWQYLIRQIANQVMTERVRLTVDIGEYKANKNRELEELALSIADNVSKSGYPQSLRSMSAYERRIIHVALADFPGVEAVSLGDEPNRYVEIKPKK